MPWVAQPPPYLPRTANEPLGVSPEGIPLGWRGLIGLEFAGFSDAAEYSSFALAAIGDIPLTSHVFFTARLPVGIALGEFNATMIGNAMLGARGVLRPGRGFWVGLSASSGLPLVSREADQQDAYQAPPVPNALWNIHEFFPNAVPFAFGVDLEGHLPVGLVFRLEIEPVLLPPFVGGEGFEFVLQHAGEVQIGRDIGGGLRLQGVALPTFEEIDNRSEFDYISADDGDLYQFALEPFFRLERDRYMLRTGLMMPMDSSLGPPFVRSWGLRVQLGMRL
jgi:hypothetical protein